MPPEHKDKSLAELVECGVVSQKAARWLSDKTKGAFALAQGSPLAADGADGKQMKCWAMLRLA